MHERCEPCLFHRTEQRERCRERRDEGGSGALILKVHEEDDDDDERVEDLLSSSNGKWETMYKAPRKQG